MEMGRMAELMVQLKHRHNDGSWGTLEPRPVHHDPADHDPEKDWADGRIYACTSCDEQMVVRITGVDGPADRE